MTSFTKLHAEVKLTRVCGIYYTDGRSPPSYVHRTGGPASHTTLKRVSLHNYIGIRVGHRFGKTGK